MEEKKKSQKVVDTYHEDKKKFPSDVLGSYTGTGLEYERPVQDADDI